MSAVGPNFTMDMSWGRLILVSLGKKRPQKNSQAQVVPATGDGARAPWLQQHSICTFFLLHPVDDFVFLKVFIRQGRR